MAIPADPMGIDLGKAAGLVSSRGLQISHQDELMLVFSWNGMEVTLYPQGKIMFFPLEDKALCIKYAAEMLESLASENNDIKKQP